MGTSQASPWLESSGEAIPKREEGGRGGGGVSEADTNIVTNLQLGE